ncbi:molybdenum cofactor biosynthesis protein [Corynebacterium sp. NML 150383]|uniref:MogA/MoaB family molybdenum cofactor biosynthesis protein n=1 Tax=Corynebacterium sp. NML 150383 TaxID=2029400 RepID=UPI000BAA4A21|nr:MogA/MoaB family molybdenum cofactor biosynthesis protein [Corynebacterium sp. NML 150383]PAT04678.1 molybdenum cofactor biosynthesis protein [Corynebacterium sp. NML 150383]
MRNAEVIVASTRASQGIYQDKSGPIAVEFLRGMGLRTPDATVVADAAIDTAVRDAIARRPSVVLISGGTGVSPDDRTVEAVAAHVDRELPGIAHAFYHQGLASTPTAILSRTVAGITQRGTFIMALPGSRGGVQDGCAVLAPILSHLLDQLEGNHAH